MKQITIIATLVAILFTWAAAATSGKAQDTGCNFVMKTVHASADSTQSKRLEIGYYDDLGRPVQTIRRGGSPDGHDLADRVEYDSLGRDIRTWQTIRSPYSNGSPVDSSVFVSEAISFYLDAAPFRENLYDGSPLDRIRKVTGPGAAWHLDGKGVTNSYLTNVGSGGDASLLCVKYAFSLSGNTGVSFSRDGIWPVGALNVEKTEDEDGRSLWVFKDMRNLTVLERRLAETASGNTSAVYADTYYLYDNAGRLVAVLPPELSKFFAQGSWSGSTGNDAKVEGFAYQYRYDARGRMIAKKLPGADWTYYIYDKGDRLVLTQDGNQRNRNEWSFRFQDALGRECLTGVLTGNYNPFAGPLGSVQVLAVRDRSDGTYDGLHGYSVSGLTLPQGAVVLTANWWDDYSFLGHEPGMSGTEYGYTDPPSGSSYGIRYGTEAHGLLTGHWSRAVGEAPSAWTQTGVREAWYYDDHGRTVFHVKGYPSGSRQEERSGYAFAGDLIALKKTMSLPGGTSHMEDYAYTYDDWGRLEKTTHSLDGATAKTLAANEYDAVGRLSETNGGRIGNMILDVPFQRSYAYNVRDWLMAIDGPLFTEVLTYENPRDANRPGQWSGNISSMQWKIGRGSPVYYDYSYDLLGRLTEAEFGETAGSSPVDYDLVYSYDLNGNLEQRISLNNVGAIANHERETQWTWSQTDGNRPAGWSQEQYDVTIISGTPPRPPQRIYSLDSSGSREESYSYDSAGNRTATLDPQSDTLNVMRYNRLNLPEEYATADGDTIRYVYSADGEKLFIQYNSTANATMGTEYAANYRIENGAITMILTDAGYYTLFPASSGGSVPMFKHIWYLKDHLGNNRLLLDGDGNVYAVHHYEPFGGEISVASSLNVTLFPASATESPYKYGGKEWNETTSSYDFETRQMAPNFHRFTTMDPLAEKYYGISPYVYCANNPVNLVDLDGTIFTERSNPFVERYLNEINSVFLEAFKMKTEYQEELQKDGLSKRRIRQLNRRINIQDDIMSEMLAAGFEMSLLIKSSQLYDIVQDSSIQQFGDSETTINGVTEFNAQLGYVQVKLNDTGVATISHELKHAFQFEQGETGFDRQTGLGSRLLHDYGDEESAYKRGSYFGGQSIPLSLDRRLSRINHSINRRNSPAVFQAIADSRGIIFRVFGKTYIGNDNTSQIKDR